ncbi:Carbon monoxide dehydrogenase subunit G [Nostocoides japonicum T1-X7]|uniref:Carbon monoxide dehydrogenase subunit G n=1 Tax=Nostocoides japonicum T1-X7 TaxID=1194083 RepID=A0A077LSV2_9MICO|nr:SRPBCC family protein [Tetrasphaera japonica]CCH76288.1 Carbon monoxide dehydrogenase subunit G [Tetrasphaera japonica T1-X7]
MLIVRTVTVSAPADRVFAYLSDFTTTTEWDPGTIRTTRRSGTGEVGTRYRNRSRFLGRETELDYVVQEFVPSRLVRLRGENRTVVAYDTMTVEPAPGGGTTVDYRAELTVKGVARLATPLVRVAFERLADDAQAGLRAALERL